MTLWEELLLAETRVEAVSDLSGERLEDGDALGERERVGVEEVERERDVVGDAERETMLAVGLEDTTLREALAVAELYSVVLVLTDPVGDCDACTEVEREGDGETKGDAELLSAPLAVDVYRDVALGLPLTVTVVVDVSDGKAELLDEDDAGGEALTLTEREGEREARGDADDETERELEPETETVRVPLFEREGECDGLGLPLGVMLVLPQRLDVGDTLCVVDGSGDTLADFDREGVRDERGERLALGQPLGDAVTETDAEAADERDAVRLTVGEALTLVVELRAGETEYETLPHGVRDGDTLVLRERVGERVGGIVLLCDGEPLVEGVREMLVVTETVAELMRVELGVPRSDPDLVCVA